MTDGFDITNEDGDFIHINYVTTEESDNIANDIDEKKHGDENEWVLVPKSNSSQPEPQLDSQEFHLEYEDISSESLYNEPTLESSFYELVTESLKTNSDESVIEGKTALATSEIEAEVLYHPKEELNQIVTLALNDTEYDELGFIRYRPTTEEGSNTEFDYNDEINSEEYRFIHEYDEEVDMCAKTKAHSELLDIYPNSFMGVDCKNDLLGARSRKRRCKKMDQNKKTDINSRFFSFRCNKDALWVYKNA